MYTVTGHGAAGVLCLPCKLKHLSGEMALWFIDGQRFIEKKGGGGKVGGWMTNPPRRPNPSRLCHYYTTDLCHLAAELNFGTSSMQNVLTYMAK